MTNLIIGNTSQLSHYFPEDYIKISSRNIDFDYLKNNKWDSVYITFAEQRIYDKNIDFITPNYLYTFRIIENLIDNSEKIVCYGSCELWSNLSGKINPDTPPDFDLTNEYAVSKLLLLNKINQLRDNQRYSKWNNVIFGHPFYFNTPYRSDYFLFGKIFKSIINKEKIFLKGNLDFYRDMIDPQFVVDESIRQNYDFMIGSGKLFYMDKFVRDLYAQNDMDFDEFVTMQPNQLEINPLSTHIVFNQKKKQDKLIMADVNYKYTYEDLLKRTQIDIWKFKGKK